MANVDLIEKALAAIRLGLTYPQLEEKTELTYVNLNGVTYYIAQEVAAFQSARARKATKRTLSSGDPQARKIDLSGSGVKWGSPVEGVSG